MSKLRERLRNTSSRQRGSMGFAPSSSAVDNSHVLVIAEVADVAAASAAIEAGAGALLFTGDAASAGAIVEAAGETPVGIRLEGATADETKAVAEAKGDFLLFDDGATAADALLERSLGRVLTLEDDADEKRLRMIAPLRLDAILLGAHNTTMTVREQLAMRRIVELTRSPLVIAVASAVSATTLEVWRDAGAPAVLATDAAALSDVVAAAREVAAPHQREDDERRDPLLPSLTAGHDHDDDDLD
ncbi:MAG TPA: hypothetical protein QF624_02395 [Dehalococcoidia bacterium]|nr:hypothetical protein [Dehalococcoidia bacterium]